MRTAKNYFEPGGDATVIGGTLTIGAEGTLKVESGATIEGVVSAPVVDNLTSTSATSALSAKQGKALDGKITTVDGKITTLSETLTAKTAAYQADSTADTVAGLVTDFNALLAKLKAAGLMGAAE